VSSEIPLLMSSRVLRWTRHHAYVNFLLSICPLARTAHISPQLWAPLTASTAGVCGGSTHVLAGVESLKVGSARV
jgi:hypothetical protein